MSMRRKRYGDGRMVRPATGQPSEGQTLYLDDEGGQWLERHENGWLLRIGRHQGEFIDDVPEQYLAWVLESADKRPTPKEEQILREALGWSAGNSGRAQGPADWHNAIIGRWTFSIPDDLAQTFDREMQRLLPLFGSEMAAFEAILGNSVTTPLESMD